RPVPRNDKIDIVQSGYGANTLEHPLAFDKGADHQNDPRFDRQPETHPRGRTRPKALSVDAVRDEGGPPAGPIPVEVVGVGADQPIAAERAILVLIAGSRPVAILSYENV